MTRKYSDQAFERLRRAHDHKKPYLINVQSATIHTGQRTVTSAQATTVLVCSACRCIVDQTWDHEDWCELFVPEPLADWLQKGAK